MLLNYIYVSKTGQKRALNEDYANVFQLSDGLLAIVCDGIGGNRAGNVASKIAGESIYNYFQSNNTDNYSQKIVEGIKSANNNILNFSKQSKDLKGMATTIVTMFIVNGNAYWGHVGDSRIYFFLGNELLQITKDHSIVQRLLDQGIINKQQAENHPLRNIIVRAIGEKPDVEVDNEIVFFDEKSNWKFFLCSDGVSNFVSHDELKKYLVGDDLNRISEDLNLLIEERGSPDNYSYVIIGNKSQL